MHSVNGIDLNGSEYETLLALVEAERSGTDPRSVADASLHPDGGLFFDKRAAEVYRGLLRRGLIDADPAMGGVVFYGVTQAGIDFVDDYAAVQAAEESAKKAQWAHDWKVAAFGAVSGGILGLVSGALSSELVAFLKSLAL